jgi:NADPH2:quinone reductase
MNSNLPTTFKAVITPRNGTSGSVKEIPLQKPGKNQVLIKVTYATINPADFGTLRGFYPVYPPPNSIPRNVESGVGLEGCGVVVEVGENCLYEHKIGSRVSFFGLGGWGEYNLVNSECCVEVAANISDEESACGANPVTAICMHQLTVEGKHKAMIQNAASSALGRMCIRYFKTKGIKTINIVRKNEYIKELQDMGGDYVLNQEDDDFDSKLTELAAKESATIAFDCIGGEMSGRLLMAMPFKSELRILGAFSMQPVQARLEDFIFEDKTIKGIWAAHWFKELGPEGVKKTLEEVKPLLGSVLKSNVSKIFKLEEYLDALTYYKGNSGKGKILLKP